jgi:hypothetical protein
MQPATYVSFAEERIRELRAEADRGRQASLRPRSPSGPIERLRLFLIGARLSRELNKVPPGAHC